MGGSTEWQQAVCRKPEAGAEQVCLWHGHSARRRLLVLWAMEEPPWSSAVMSLWRKRLAWTCTHRCGRQSRSVNGVCRRSLVAGEMVSHLISQAQGSIKHKSSHCSLRWGRLGYRREPSLKIEGSEDSLRFCHRLSVTWMYWVWWRCQSGPGLTCCSDSAVPALSLLLFSRQLNLHSHYRCCFAAQLSTWQVVF